MSKKVSITLDDEVLEFIDRLASNRSRFINPICRQYDTHASKWAQRETTHQLQPDEDGRRSQD